MSRVGSAPRAATLHDLVVDHCLFKSAFVFMAKIAAEDSADMDMAVVSKPVFDFYNELNECVSDLASRQLFSAIVKDRCKAAVQILGCGVPAVMEGEDAPRLAQSTCAPPFQQMAFFAPVPPSAPSGEIANKLPRTPPASCQAIGFAWCQD